MRRGGKKTVRPKIAGDGCLIGQGKASPTARQDSAQTTPNTNSELYCGNDSKDLRRNGLFYLFPYSPRPFPYVPRFSQMTLEQRRGPLQRERQSNVNCFPWCDSPAFVCVLTFPRGRMAKSRRYDAWVTLSRHSVYRRRKICAHPKKTLAIRNIQRSQSAATAQGL